MTVAFDVADDEEVVDDGIDANIKVCEFATKFWLWITLFDAGIILIGLKFPGLKGKYGVNDWIGFVIDKFLKFLWFEYVLVFWSFVFWMVLMFDNVVVGEVIEVHIFFTGCCCGGALTMTGTGIDVSCKFGVGGGVGVNNNCFKEKIIIRLQRNENNTIIYKVNI